MKRLFVLLGLFAPPSVAWAANPNANIYDKSFKAWSDLACTMLPYCQTGGVSGVVIVTKIVIDTVLLAMGSVAVVIILYASIRLITSAGNDETVRKAWKETIFYAALGLVLAILSDALLKFVVDMVAGIAVI